MIKPIFEFILWNNCNNNCVFCPQVKLKNFSSLEQKCIVLENIKKFILSNKYENGSHVLLVGGEMFDRSNIHIKNDIVDIFNFIAYNMVSKNIDLCYINTNLIYDINDILIDVLNLFSKHNLLNRLKFTTSYDIYGRFQSYRHKKMFKDNLKQLKQRFPMLNIVVNAIMTKQLCKSFIDSKVSLLQYFKKHYKCSMNLLPYIGDDKHIKPIIKDVFQFLKHEDECNNFINEYVQNFDLPQDKYVHKFIDGKFALVSAEKMKCGHVENFSKYSTGNTCFICDMKTLFNIE